MKRANPVCYRYPQMFVCGCTIPCRIAMKEVSINHVIDNLYIGPVQAAYDVNKLKDLNITHIVNLSGMDYHTEPSVLQYISLEIEDNSNEDISQFFMKTNQIIENTAPTNVLVHCKAGVSRSVSICIAYLMWKHKMNFTKALELMVQCNPRSKPNNGFRSQLEQYGEHLGIS